jgi:hypothetical protein|tara:strand:+ start:3739 stop:4107 length:369 start_codon:yes stop_codon:yes gene_type:complete
VTTEQKIKTSLSILFIIYFLAACSGSSEPKGAHWEGNANFMHITKGKKDMIYSVDVIGQKVFLEGYYEIIKFNTDEVLYRIRVDQLEFGKTEGGTNFCRVWGQIDETLIRSYLYSTDCFPIS